MVAAMTRLIYLATALIYLAAGQALALDFAARPEMRPQTHSKDHGLQARARGPAFANAPRPRHSARPVPGGAGLSALLSGFDLGAQHSVVLMDVATGRVLEAHNGAAALPPASVTKLITARYGMASLGRNYQFTTRILATGPLSGGTLSGDLILSGGGDPALDSDELAGLAAAVKQAGISRVTGRFLVDPNALPHFPAIEPGQPDHVAYNPGISGINLNFNRVYAEWGPGGRDLRLEARAEAQSPQVSVVRATATDQAGPIFRYRARSGHEAWQVARAAMNRAGGRWLPVRRPAIYAGEVFRILARNAGISLPKPDIATRPQTGREIARHARRALPLVCRGMLHFSTNLTAEIIGLTASRARGGAVTDLATSAATMQNWAANAGLPRARFRDHSGLNAGNRLSGGDMAAFLVDADRVGAFDGLIRRYFVPAKDGKTPALDGADVRAKTGTLNFVRGLAGYITGPKGRRLAFTIFSADLSARDRIDHGLEMPPGTRRFARRAVALEKEILRRWLTLYAG